MCRPNAQDLILKISVVINPIILYSRSIIMGTLEVFIAPQHQIKWENIYNYEIATYSAAIKSSRCQEKL